MSDTPLSIRLAVIGAGQMAEALIGGLLISKTLARGSVWATDTVAERRDLMARKFGIKVGLNNEEAAASADVVLLAVKPQSLDSVVNGMGSELPGKLVISIAAGVPIERISRLVPDRVRIIRVMPNSPALMREGMSALAMGPGVSEDDSRLGRLLFEAVGRVVVLEERLMEAVTGLSGSGPAYAYMTIEAMADGGVKMGLSRDVAQVLAAQTMVGAAKMVLGTDFNLAHLMDQAVSPGGPTMAGLSFLEQGGYKGTLMAGVEAATRRSEDLGRACL